MKDSDQLTRVPVTPGQRRSASPLHPGLIVRVLSESRYVPSLWICTNERTGRKIAVRADEFDGLLPECGVGHPARRNQPQQQPKIHPGQTDESGFVSDQNLPARPRGS